MSLISLWFWVELRVHQDEKEVRLSISLWTVEYCYWSVCRSKSLSLTHTLTQSLGSDEFHWCDLKPCTTTPFADAFNGMKHARHGITTTCLEHRVAYSIDSFISAAVAQRTSALDLFGKLITANKRPKKENKTPFNGFGEMCTPKHLNRPSHQF